ncbi:hypothetical protein PPERSA_06066 [Pseudocohnilembus persalinus]|uniref:EamA domain-containing protein n=1 Tax=Pseudocohnilembus persalinus TaxID=266149 RepID=A0A0V0QW61_PSEPJ|nr:hypothetical protein PPERSA_06066 [Pseudocohnilembus persalinus]|eukprot:KRX06184.1 hypothetical protein PPERSA_06066 [Pseudocohnilembus persalinus]
MDKHKVRFSLNIVSPKRRFTTIHSEKEELDFESKISGAINNQNNNNNEVSMVVENQELQKLLKEKQLNAHRLTMHMGGGFGINLNDMIAFDDETNNKLQQNQFTSQKQDQNQSKISVFFKNERLTLNNPYHLNFINQDKQELEQYFSKDYIQRIPLVISFMILMFFVMNASIIPCWIMSIEAEKYLRQSWRFFMSSWLILPFVMWEKRQPKFKKFYQLSYIFDWTYVGYSINLGSLQLFFLSLQRAKSDSHTYEYPGRLLVILGIILIFIECINFTPEEIPPSSYNYIVQKYIHRNVWERCILGNGAALSISYILTKFAKNNAEVNQIYPPHLRMFLTFFFNSINLSLSSYFFSGSDLSNQNESEKPDFWGWTALFSSHQFSGFFFMSIIVGLGSFVSSMYIGKAFQPLDIQTAMSFEPVFATLFVYIAGVQFLPGNLGIVGFIFIIPGIFFINLGQYLKVQEKQKEIEDKINQEKQIIQKMQQQQSQLQTPSVKSQQKL